MMAKCRFSSCMMNGLILLLAFSVSSCQKAEKARLPIYPAVGKLLVQGKPVEKVMVVLHPLNGLDLQGAPKPNAKTLADGTFMLSTYDGHDGAPAGKYAVLCFSFRNEADEDGYTDRFLGRYSNPAKPVTTVEILPGENHLKTIDLK